MPVLWNTTCSTYSMILDKSKFKSEECESGMGIFWSSFFSTHLFFNHGTLFFSLAKKMETPWVQSESDFFKIIVVYMESGFCWRIQYSVTIYWYHHKPLIMMTFLTDENEQIGPLANKDAKKFHSILVLFMY